ncbi:hypothetical protein DUT91_04325 [Phyllobacterium salinisoli]|uniref:Uncharacterized protein n=1 Tax=Phyllobacterium salinisoli TaxID=1899321 RepID=A0A368K9F0_9HYPH|nr:hypothetical protein DUT91_04325 [Phyllobacterium salinisoli]
MNEVVTGSTRKPRPVPSHILQRIQAEMPKPSNDRTRISDILRLAKGGYSRCRRKLHLPQNSQT